ncbi:MAG: segregation/condensation protein A [Eubacteriales bacterium]|nr:segregation/condensation protein A [Eubacteriales bacterium]
MESIKFNLDAFEGPLDLLLHLIQKNKVNICDIPISSITDQYMEHIKKLKEFDLDTSSEFLVIAAQLLQIKSKMLLPQENEEEVDEEDPREELARRLIEYRNFKAAALYLRQYEEAGSGVVVKTPEYIERKIIDKSFKELTIENLIKSLVGLHDKNTSYNTDIREKMEQIVLKPRISVFTKVKSILKKIKNIKKIKFKELFKSMDSKSEAVAGFLAVLELLKLNRLKLTTQDGEYILEDNIKSKKDEK